MADTLTIREAAAIARIPRRTMLTWVVRGRFPNAYKDPHCPRHTYRIPRAHLRAFWQRRRQEHVEALDDIDRILEDLCP